MIRAIPLTLGLVLSAAALAQQPAPAPAPAPAAKPAPAAARPDPTDPKMRDTPVRCRPGQLDRAGGKTLGQIFGAQWPATPDVPAARRSPAQALTLGRVDWPAERGQAVATTAVLVDAQGKPLRAKVLCVSADGADAAVERAAMAGTYRAAMVDGKPVAGVAMVAWRLGAARPGR